jgi:hypothetical protein
MNTKLPPFVKSMKLEIEQTQPLANLSSFLPKELKTIPEELESFCLPNSPFLLTHPNYRKLYNGFMETRACLIDAISLIAKYEVEIIPLYRDLAILHVDEDKVRPREQDLQKIDLVERAELIIRKQISREAEAEFKRPNQRSSLSSTKMPSGSKDSSTRKIITKKEDTARRARVERKMKINLDKVKIYKCLIYRFAKVKKIE